MTPASRGDQDKGGEKTQEKLKIKIIIKKDSNPSRLPHASLGMLEKCTIREAAREAEVVRDWQAAPAQGRTSPGTQQREGSGGSSSLAPYGINSLIDTSGGSDCRPGPRSRSRGCSGSSFIAAQRWMLETTLDVALEVALEMMLETAPVLMPANSRHGSWVWGCRGAAASSRAML